MTALDQAFIKAFSRQDPTPLAVAPRPAARSAGEAELAPKAWPSETPAREPARKSVAPLVQSEPTVVLGPSVSTCEFSGESIDTLSTSPWSSMDEIWAALEKNTQAAMPSVVPEAAPCEMPAAVVPPVTVVNAAPVKEISLPTVVKAVTAPEVLPVAEIPPAPAMPKVAEVKIEQPQTPAAKVSVPEVQEKRSLKPAWQVEHFNWPKVCRRLIERAAGELDSLANAMLSAGQKGQKVLAMGSCHSGEGATTLLLCAARRLSERGVNVIIVDANLERPSVAKRLGFEPQMGWDETSDAESESLEQAIVEATADRVAILPERAPTAESGRTGGNPLRLAGCLEVLKDHYDMVLIDVGALENGGLFNSSWGRSATRWIDGVVVVQNRRLTSDEELQAVEGKLAVAGLAVEGVVENFVADESDA